MTKQTEKPHQDQAGSLLKSAFRQLEADIRTLDERLVAEGKPIELVLAERAAQLALINDIGRQIAAELELNVLLKRATRLIQATFDYHHVALFLKDEALLKLKAVSGSYQDYFPANHTQRLGEGINGWVATHGEKVVANDVGLEPRYISLISEHSITKAELCLPIKVAGQTIGVLDIQSPTLNAFNQNDIIAMETLTNQVAVAIKNALLYGTAQQELTERKRAELALKQERDRAQKYLDVAGVILVALNEAGQIALINQQGCQLLGYTEAELLGQDWFATCLPSQIRKEVKSVFCQLMTGNTEPVEYYENRILTKTGQERIIAWHSTVLTDEAGAIIGVLASGEDITERKQAEQALRESEARYRTLFNYAQDIIIVENAQHQILDANQAASQFYGYTRQELLTMSTLDLLPSPEQIQEMHPFYTSQNIGEGERFEILTRRRNGLLVPVEITITRLHAGEQTEFLSIIRDITEHKRAEEELQAAVNERTGELIAANEHLRHEISERERVEKALRESEEKYRTLIEQSSDAIYLIYDGKFEIINRRFEELFGVTLEIANRPGFSFSNLIVPKSREKVSELIAGMPEEQKRDRRYEFTALDKAGNPIEIEVSVSYPSYRGGLATQGIIRDITARRQIEEAQQKAYQQAQEYAAELATKIQEEQRQRKIATILAEVVGSVSLTLSTDELLYHILLKLQQLIFYDSASIFLAKEDQLVIEAAYGFEREIVHNQHELQEDRLFLEMQVNKSYLLIEDTRSDERYQIWPGAEKVRSWVGAPLLVASEPIGYLAVDRHVAGAFTSADAELVQAFAHQVAQTIYNARLFADLREIQARLIQRERLAALGQMAATVAHELRNPLMGIRMGVEYLMRDVPETDSRWRGVTLMQTNMDRIDRIVGDILYVARVPQPVLAPALLQTIIQQEVARWELTLAEKKIRCHTQLAKDLPSLLLDPDQMARVFSNLIGNSVDSLNSNGEIRITLNRVNENQIVTVADNGPGILPEDLPKIFEPFFTTKARGTGLGLSIVRQIVERHGGKIDARSEIGVGTQFIITLSSKESSRT